MSVMRKKVKVVDDFQRWVMDLYLKSNHVPDQITIKNLPRVGEVAWAVGTR